MASRYVFSLYSLSFHLLNRCQLTFGRKKYLISMRSNLIKFFSYEQWFWYQIWELFPCPGYQRFSLMFFCKNCIVLHFIVSIWHIWNCFLYQVWGLSQGLLTFWPVGAQLFQHHFFKRLSFFLWISSAPLLKTRHKWCHWNSWYKEFQSSNLHYV